MEWFIIGAIVGLVINIVLSNKFADIAEDKGYTRTSYFWACFFLGTLGCLMVAALPDLEVRAMVRKLKSANNTSFADTNILQNGGWKCDCGRINASYVSSCVCGKNKRQL